MTEQKAPPEGISWGRERGRVNRLAVAAFAIAWLLPVGGLPAVVLGVMAHQEINDLGGRERGKGLANWAILVGLINIAVVIAAIVLTIIALTKGGGHHHSSGLGCAAWEEADGLC